MFVPREDEVRVAAACRSASRQRFVVAPVGALLAESAFRPGARRKWYNSHEA